MTTPDKALVASDQAPSGLAPTGFDPSRFTNARLAYAMQHIARRANAEIACHVQGMWNERYCNADASDRAMQVFSEIEGEIAHWKAIATEARSVERSRKR